MIQVTTLMDNQASRRRGLINEHGLSYYIEGPTFRFLFDCGAGPHIQDNAHCLGRSLNDLDAVILSHSHYDHAGGYRDLLEAGLGSSVLYTGPHFLEPKYARAGVKYCDLSCGFDEKFLQQHHIDHRIVPDCREIASGVFLLGGFPLPEQTGGSFYRLTEGGMIPDDFPDEICLVFDRGSSLTVLVGCSHPGIVTMIRHAARVLGKPVSAVYGGTHLAHSDEEQIRRVISGLKDLGLQTLGFSHCSGQLAETLLQQYPDLCSCHMGVGDCIFM